MKPFLLAGLIPALLGGCVSAPLSDPLPFRSPSDIDAGIRDTTEGGAVGEYNNRQPVPPRNWRQLNDDQGPDGGGGS